MSSLLQAAPSIALTLQFGPSWPDMCFIRFREAIMATAQQTNYRGPERRRHRVFVTLNSEYHCRDGICVAVRDRRTGEFVTQHPALGKHVSGGLRFNAKGGIESATPATDVQPGEQVCFTAGDGDRTLITSPLSTIERPPKDVVATYRP